MNGLFITFEGPDGAGKTTQLNQLVQYLKDQLKLPVVQTREPGGTRISDYIRSLILNPDHAEMDAKTEVLLYAASRAQHVQEVIMPALKNGAIVVCDRFVDASIAYQGYGLEFGEEVVKQINKFATGGLEPTRTYMIDLPPEVGRERLQARREAEFNQLDRIEQKELEYHQRVRQGFLHLAQLHSRIKLLNGAQSIEEIQAEIRTDIKKVIGNRLQDNNI